MVSTDPTKKISRLPDYEKQENLEVKYVWVMVELVSIESIQVVEVMPVDNITIE